LGNRRRQVEAKKSAHVRIAYTGRLLGYARIPSEQSRSLTSCPAEDRGDEFTQRQLAQTLSAAPVLVGMGNNFAPELNARMFAGPKPPAVPPELKDRFEWDGHKWVLGSSGPWFSAPVDNVGCYGLQTSRVTLTNERRCTVGIPTAIAKGPL